MTHPARECGSTHYGVDWGSSGSGGPNIEAAAQYLYGTQGPDGGWSHVPGVPSRTGITTTVLRAKKSG